MADVKKRHLTAAAEALNKTGCQGVCHCHSKYIAQAIADAEERGKNEERAQVVAAIWYWSRAKQIGTKREFERLASEIEDGTHLEGDDHG